MLTWHIAKFYFCSPFSQVASENFSWYIDRNVLESILTFFWFLLICFFIILWYFRKRKHLFRSLLNERYINIFNLWKIYQTWFLSNQYYTDKKGFIWVNNRWMTTYISSKFHSFKSFSFNYAIFKIIPLLIPSFYV